MQVCLPAGCIDAIRVSLVDACTDLPICGPSTGYVFNCFRAVELTTNIEDGDETVLRNECGKKCFQTRKPDELTNIGLAFELLNPDYELTALLTGQPLINDGSENIGWYQREGQTHSPWVCVELFEQVPDESCAVGHRYRRLVIPKIRFKLPSNTREDPFRIIPFEGVSSARSVAGYGEGPFHDSPFDFSGIGSDVETHYMEFFDDTIEGTLEGNCGFLTVTCGELFAAMWTGQDELTVTADEGDGPFCDADEIVIELEDGDIVVIPLPDPNVQVVDCDTIIITGWDVYNPDNQPIASITARLAGQPLGGYDATSGLPDGELAHPIPPSAGLIDELFPGIGSGDGHILMGGNSGPGCWHLTMWYNCNTDRLAVGFNRKDLYGVPASVVRTEIETDNGIFSSVPVVDEWKTPLSVWTYGSGMTIEDAAALYGTHWNHIRVYDINDDLICEFTEPQQTWNGGPWRLDPIRCVEVEETNDPPLTPSLFTPQSLILVSGGPDLSTYETIEWTTIGNSGTVTRNMPSYNVDTVYSPPNIIMVNIDPTDTLTDLVVKDGVTTLASWSGSLVLTPADQPNVSGTGVVPGGGGQITVHGNYFLTAALGPIDSFKLIMDDMQEFTYYVPGSPNVGLNPPGSVVSVPLDRSVSITDAGIVGMTIDSIEVSDVDFDYTTGYGINPDVTVT